MELKGQTVRKIVIQMIAIAMAQCTVLMYHPIGIAFFAAAYTEGIWRYALFPLMIASMAFVLEPIALLKYGITMLVTAVIVSVTESWNRKKRGDTFVPEGLLCLICGLAAGAMEAGDFAFSVWEWHDLVMIGGLGLLTAALTFFMRRAVRLLMRKPDRVWISSEDMVSLSVLAGILAYFMSRQSFLPEFVAPAFMIAVVLYMAGGHGAGMGAVSGTICGIVLALQQNNVEALGALCMLGLLGGCFQKLGKAGVLAGGAVGVSLSYFLGAGWLLDEIWLQAAAAGAGIFLIIPYSFRWKSNERAEFLSNRWGQENEEPLYAFRNRRMEQTAESFRNLSVLFRKREEPDDIDGDIDINDIRPGMDGTAVCASCETRESCMQEEKERMSRIWRARLEESREAVADQMAEVSQMMEECCRQQETVYPLSEEMEDKIWQEFRAQGMILKKIMALEQKNGRRQVMMFLRTAAKERHPPGNIPVKKAAAICGDCMGLRLMPTEDCPKYIAKEGSVIYLTEETNFQVLAGTASRKKGREEVSGDNFGYMDLPDGQMLFGLSDGAGSGAEANGKSATLLELVEQFLEGGIGCENALRLINSVMSMDLKGNHATADMGVLDLYSGVCHFVKMGAAATFIRRDTWVEVISCRNLPMGVIESPKMERTIRKLYDGDFIVMVTDGLLDSLEGTDKEQILSDAIAAYQGSNPKDLAERLLALADKPEHKRDDAMALVLALWEKQ